jgi:hypothetical protein
MEEEQIRGPGRLECTEQALEFETETTCDSIQGVLRHYERYCNEVHELNDYIHAYFRNVHPLFPVLHEGAFKRLYGLYGLKARSDFVRQIADASSREGRAVSLICSVLALGAWSLVESGNTNLEMEESSLRVPPPHYGEALGFYAVCLRLQAYTHDNIETMMTYLFMVFKFKFPK